MQGPAAHGPAFSGLGARSSREGGSRGPRREADTRRGHRRTPSLKDRVTGRYDQFRQAVERARTGEWSAEELEAFLVQLYDLLSEKAQDCRAFIQESGYRDEAPDEVDSGLSGIDLYEAGIQEMYQYLHDGDDGHLSEGLRLLWEGNEKINQAMFLNRESREDLDLTFFL